MKTTKNYWFGKMKVERVRLKEYGFAYQTTFYLFGRRGLGVVIGYDPIEAPAQQAERIYNADLEDMTGYNEWRAENKLMRLSDEEFDLIMNTRF